MTMMLCPFCKSEVLYGTGSIQCLECVSLFHLACANLNTNEVDLIENNEPVWRCEKCTQGCHGLSNSQSSNSSSKMKKSCPSVSETTPLKVVFNMFQELCDRLDKVQEDQKEVLKAVAYNANILNEQSVKLTVIEADLAIMRDKQLHAELEKAALKSKLQESKKRMDQVKQAGPSNVVERQAIPMMQQLIPYKSAIDVGAMFGVQLGASSKETTPPSPQNPGSGFQASTNPNSSNARPHLNSAFGGNPFTLHSIFPSSELRFAPSKFSWSYNAGPAMNSSSSMSVSKPVLRPSQLMSASSPFSSSNTSASSPFQSKAGYTLHPSKLGNPFAKVTSETKIEEAMDTESGPSKEKDPEVNSKTGSESAVVAPKFVPLGKKEGVERTDMSSSSSSLSSGGSIQASPHSKPNSTESASPVSLVARASHSTISTSPASSGFVFGQNLHERVEASPSESCSSGASPQVNGVNCSSEGSDSGSQVAASTPFGASKVEKYQGAATNGDSEMLFSSVLKRESTLERLNNDGGEGSHSKSLSEAAREYEESRAVKRKYEEVAIITGEEDEDNVLQITCKLFAFNIEKSSWVERGRGQLRVNDKCDPEKQSKKQSRLVMRTQGSLRVVLNTKIWAGMSVVRASPKSIRMTAMDENQIRVFLIMASPADTERLLHVLVCRVEVQKQLEEESKARKEDSGSEPETCTIEIPSPAKKVCEAKENAVDMGTELSKTNNDCAKGLDGDEKKNNMIEEPQHSDHEAST